MVLSGFDFPAMVKSRRFQAWNRVRGDLLLAETGIVSERQSFSVHLNRVPPPIRFSEGGANPRNASNADAEYGQDGLTAPLS